MRRTSCSRLFALSMAVGFSILSSSGCLFFAIADAGPDGGAPDAGGPDGGVVDAGGDGGLILDDGGALDAGGIDGGPTDAGSDGGPIDGGPDDGGNIGPIDGGPDDGGIIGPVDSGPPDGGPDDGGIVVPGDGGPTRVDWFDEGSPKRIGLKLTANDTSFAGGDPLRIVVDHAALVTAGARANGSDLFVVFDDSPNDASIVSHRLTAGGSFNESNTELMIRLEAPIPLGGSDNRYSIYFGGNPPSLPIPTVSTSRVFSYESGADVWTTSDADIDTQPEAAFAFTAYNGDEWMFAASWRQRTTGLSEDQDEEFCSVVRVRINGEPYLRGATASQFRDGWRMMGVIGKFPTLASAMGTHFIELDLFEGEPQGIGELRDVRIVAFQLLGGAFDDDHDLDEAAYSQNTELVKVEFDGFGPQPLLFAGSAIREGPQNSGGNGLRVLLNGAGLVQNTRDSKIATDYFKPMFHAQQVPALVGGELPTQATINVLPAGAPGNSVVSSTIVAADSARYVEVASTSNLNTVSVTDGNVAQIVSLSLPQTPVVRQRVTFVTADLQHARNGAPRISEPGLRVAGTGAGGAFVFADEIADNRDQNEWSTAAFVVADQTRGALNLAVSASLGQQSADNGVVLSVRHAHIVSFSYPMAFVEMGVVEDISDGG